MRYANLILLLFITGCDDEFPTVQDFPIVHTLPVVDINENGLTFQAEFIQPGRQEVTSHGFVWHRAGPEFTKEHYLTMQGAPTGSFFEARPDSSIVGGVWYQVSAFITYDDFTVYGSGRYFMSMGSTRDSWSLIADSIDFSMELVEAAASNEHYGYVVFRSGGFLPYDPKSNEFLNSIPYPVSSPGSNEYLVVSSGEIVYCYSNIDEVLYRLENTDWSVESDNAPSGLTAGVYTHAHRSGNMLFFLGSYNSASYDLDAKKWETKANVLSDDSFSAYAGVTFKDSAYVMTYDKRIFHYDEPTDSWRFKTVFPGEFFDNTVTFANQDRFYFGLPHDRHEYPIWIENALWSFDVVSGTWRQEEPMPFTPDRGTMFWFTIGDDFYLGNRSLRFELWRFDPS